MIDMIELEETLKNIEEIANNYPSRALPFLLKNNVPAIFIELYGEERGKEEWDALAEKAYKFYCDDLKRETAALFKHVIEMYKRQLECMYKGEDGKDYTSFDDLQEADREYVRSLNPLKGRRIY